MFTLNDSFIDVTCFFKFPISDIQFGFRKKFDKTQQKAHKLTDHCNTSVFSGHRRVWFLNQFRMEIT